MTQMTTFSPRQYDCLRLVAEGATSQTVASRLGIAVSTVEKHLAAGRKKLGVSRTSQAITVYWQLRSCCCASGNRSVMESIAGLQAYTGETLQFANELTSALSLNTASAALERHLANFGIEGFIFGVIAEPFGEFTNGARIVATNLSPELMQIYEAQGGTKKDPVARRVASCVKPFEFDVRETLRGFLGPRFSQFKDFAEALLDNRFTRIVVIPCRDDATGAPFSLTVSLDAKCAQDYDRHGELLENHLRSAADLFWTISRKKRLVAQLAGLSQTQKQVLDLCTRGFYGAQIADQMNISRRAVEKQLSNTRKQLGAKTTPAAVFRALVYGAI